MLWVRDYTDSDSHPQMLKAGPHGRAIFRFLCRVSGKHELGGKIPEEYLDPTYLVGQLGMKCCHGCSVPTVTHAADGLTNLFVVKLLRRNASGVAIIDGWKRKQPRADPTNAERQQRLREKKRNALRNVTGVTLRNGPREEKRREEKNRIDQKHLSATADTPAPSVKELQGLWNSIVGTPGWADDAHGREKPARARLKEKPDLDYWRRVIERIAASSFCRGGGKDGWVASPDFLVQPDTHVKVMEGKYDDRAPVPKRVDAFARYIPPTPDEEAERLARGLKAMGIDG